VLAEQLSITPALNDINASFGSINVTVAAPVRKRLSISLTALDSFLDDPPPGKKKNSFEFTAGLTYALK
jgi:hypothetical protein